MTVKTEDTKVLETIKQLKDLKAKLAESQEALLKQVETKKTEYDEMASLYREAFGTLPWDVQIKVSQGHGKLRSITVEKDGKEVVLQGASWSLFAGSIYDFVNMPADLRAKVIWGGNWTVLRNLLLKAGCVITDETKVL